MTARLLPPPQDPRRSGFTRAAVSKPTAAAPLPDRLAELGRLVALAPSSARQFHVRLRPALRDIAAHRLRTSHGIDLDGQPDEARARLGADLYDVVRGDRPVPPDRTRAGPSVAAVARFVERLEEL